MRRVVFLIITIALALPLYSQNLRQIRSDASVIFAEASGDSPEEAEALATEELLSKLSGTSIINGSSEQVRKIWKTYSSEVRVLGSVVFDGKTVVRYIKWDMVNKVFDSRRKTISDLLDGAAEAIASGKPALARTYLDWVKIYLQTLPQSENESIRLKKLDKAAGEGAREQVNMKHIVRETAEIQRILGRTQDKKSETAIIKEEPKPIVKSEEILKPKRQELSLESVNTPVSFAFYKNTSEIVLTQKLSPDIQDPITDNYVASISGKFSAYIRTSPANPFALGAMTVYKYRGFGIYASFMKSLTSVSASYDCMSDGSTSFGYFWASGKEKKTAMAVSAGAVLRLSGPFEAYIGGGYGASSVYMEDTSAQWAKVTDKSHRGAFFEAGIIANIGRFSVSAGFGSVVLKTFTPIAAIGFRF